MAILAGACAAFFALSPQINLWTSKTVGYNGIYASHDMDEIGYAAYLGSLIDGKPRRNSPYTGAEDSGDTPLKESLFSVQFLGAYPIATIARALDLSLSQAFILASGLYGFLAGLAVFWLFLLLFRNPFLAFVGTLFLFACGALAAGQGNLIRSYAPKVIFYEVAFPFARRSVPLAGFFALFLFFCGVWKFLNVETFRKRTFYCLVALAAFVVLVYSYFYLWTTAFAWLVGFALLLAIFRPEDHRCHLQNLAILAAGMVAALVPYFLLLSNRSETTDSVQLLQFTRMPDLTRPPAVISLVIMVVFAVLGIAGRTKLKDFRTVFLISFALVSVVVFNQQVLTGRSLQPVHYQFFAANYTALFAFLSLVFLLLTNYGAKYLNLSLLLVGVIGFYVGYVEVKNQRSFDILRDDIVPVASKVREISPSGSDIVLSFDATGFGYPTSDEMPSLASRPVLWAPHQRVFGDVSTDQNLERFFYFLYLQNKDDAWLRNELQKKNSLVVHGIFGWGRSENEVLGDSDPFDQQEIDHNVELYRAFINSFDLTRAAKYPISFVVAHELAKESFGTFDRYYERELVGKFMRYNLFRTTLRADAP